MQDPSVQSIVAAEGEENDIPWFGYPMKLGVIGILGSIYLVSYFFKKFEKEIFIFGLIAITAIFLGSYYDEHRFSKYVMAGLTGPASILVYELLVNIQKRWNRSLDRRSAHCSHCYV